MLLSTCVICNRCNLQHSNLQHVHLHHVQCVTRAICNTFNLNHIKFAPCAICNMYYLQHGQFATHAICNTCMTNQLDGSAGQTTMEEWRGPYLVSRVVPHLRSECPVIHPVHWKGVSLPRQRSSRTLKTLSNCKGFYRVFSAVERFLYLRDFFYYFDRFLISVWEIS